MSLLFHVYHVRVFLRDAWAGMPEVHLGSPEIFGGGVELGAVVVPERVDSATFDLEIGGSAGMIPDLLGLTDRDMAAIADPFSRYDNAFLFAFAIARSYGSRKKPVVGFEPGAAYISTDMLEDLVIGFQDCGLQLIFLPSHDLDACSRYEGSWAQVDHLGYSKTEVCTQKKQHPVSLAVYCGFENSFELIFRDSACWRYGPVGLILRGHCLNHNHDVCKILLASFLITSVYFLTFVTMYTAILRIVPASHTTTI